MRERERERPKERRSCSVAAAFWSGWSARDQTLFGEIFLRFLYGRRGRAATSLRLRRVRSTNESSGSANVESPCALAEVGFSWFTSTVANRPPEAPPGTKRRQSGGPLGPTRRRRRRWSVETSVNWRVDWFFVRRSVSSGRPHTRTQCRCVRTSLSLESDQAVHNKRSLERFRP